MNKKFPSTRGEFVKLNAFFIFTGQQGVNLDLFARGVASRE
jgi:hypothetical protein